MPAKRTSLLTLVSPMAMRKGLGRRLYNMPSMTRKAAYRPRVLSLDDIYNKRTPYV